MQEVTTVIDRALVVESLGLCPRRPTLEGFMREFTFACPAGGRYWSPTMGKLVVTRKACRLAYCFHVFQCGKRYGQSEYTLHVLED